MYRVFPCTDSDTSSALRRSSSLPLSLPCSSGGISRFLFISNIFSAIVTHGGGPLVTGSVNLTTGMNASWSALKALNVIIGLFSSLAVNMPDFGRFSKYENAGYSQFIFLPLLGTLGALAPIFVTSAAEYLWGEYIWFMPAVIAKFDSRAAMVSFLPLTLKLIHSSSLDLP